MFGHIDLALLCIYVEILLSVYSYDNIVYIVLVRWELKSLCSVMIIS